MERLVRIMRRLLMKTCFGLVLVVGLCVPTALAADLYVGTEAGDYATIADALAAAAPGDNIIVRAGTYTEDVTIDKPDVGLTTTEGAFLNGDVSIEAELVRFWGFEMPEGKNITVADGMSYTGPSMTSGVSIQSGGHDNYDVIIGDVTMDLDDYGTGAKFILQNGSVTHTGTMDVKSRGAWARGFDLRGAQEATLGTVKAEAVSGAMGILFGAVDGTRLSVTGDISATASSADSWATGLSLRSTEFDADVEATIGTVTVSSGRLATGVQVFNTSGEDGRLALNIAGPVVVTGTEADTEAQGVAFNNTDNIDATLADVTVSGGAFAQGIGIDIDRIGGSGSIGENAVIHMTGDITVEAREAGSEALGVALEGGSNFDMTLQNVSSEAGASAVGIELLLQNDGSLEVAGDVETVARDAGSNALGVSAQGNERLSMTVGNVSAEAGDEVVGVAMFSGNEGSLVHDGLIEATARDGGSEAAGLVLMGMDDLTGEIGNMTVEAGAAAAGMIVGIYGDRAGINQTGHIVATARDAGSESYGVDLAGAGDDLSLTVDNITATGGALAKGIAADDTILVRPTVGNNADIVVTGAIEATATDAGSAAYGASIKAGENFSATFGDVTAAGGGLAGGISLSTTSGGTLTHTGFIDVTGSDADSVAEGVHVMATTDMNATVGDIDAEAGARATGVYWRTSGDGGSLIHAGNLSATAREGTSEAYGVNVVAENDFSLTVGTANVNGGNLARGVSYYVGQGGRLTMDGDVTATTGGNAHGVLVNAGREFESDIKNVTVTGGGNVVQGVAATMGDRGTIRHAGTVTVQGTELVSNVRGVNINAADDMDVSLGDIDVAGLNDAIGIYTNAADGGTLTQSGTIRAKTMADGSTASGTVITAGDDFTLTIGDVVAAADGTGSQVRGAHVMAGAGFTARGGDVTVTGQGFASGVNLYFSTDADIEFGTIDVESIGADSTALGMGLFGGTDAEVALGDVIVSAAARATGVSLNHLHAAAGDVLDNARLIHAGVITAVGMGADSTAEGVSGTVGDDFKASLGDIRAKAKKSTWGVSLNTGDRAEIQVDAVEAVAEEADSHAYGATFSGKDDFAVTLGEVVARAGREARAVTVRGDEAVSLDVDTVAAEAGTYASGVSVDGASSTVTVRGDVSATTRGGAGLAQGLIVNSAVADVTNDGHVYASANNATGVGFGYGRASDRIQFHNLGVVETSANGGAAVSVNVTDVATVQNDGTIDAGDKVAFAGGHSTGSISLDNTGAILGDVWTGQGADTLSVSGTGRIVGNVNMGTGDDEFVLKRSATVDGHVILGDGDDEATIHYGAVLTGMLDGGLGDDTLTLLGARASTLPPGSAWNHLSARNIEQTWIDGGAWQLGIGTNLGQVDVGDAFLRIDDPVAIANLHLHDGALVGVGNVTGDVTNDGGVMSPGNSFGILTITGNYTQGADGVLLIELDASTDPDAGVNYDQLVIVGGTATFAGGTTVRIRPTFGATRPDRAEYTIVKGNVSFDPDTINLEVDMPERLFYGGWLESGSMKLILAVVPYASIGETTNQRAVGQALTRAKSKPDTDLVDLYDWLDNLPSSEADAARAAFDSLSGEVYAHAAGLNSRIVDRFAGAVLRSVGADSTQEAGAPERNVWAAGYTDTGRAGDANGAAATLNLSGLVAGVDLVQRPNLRIGVSVGGGTASMGVNERSSTLQGNGYLLGVYGQFDFDDVGLTAVLGFGQETHNARRVVQFAGDQWTSTAAFSTNNIFVMAEARSASVAIGDLPVEPVAALGWFGSHRAAFREQGAGTFGLIVDEYAASHWYGRFGLEPVFEALQWGSAVVRPHARFAYATDFGSVPTTATMRWQGAATTPFTVTGSDARASGIELALGLTGTSSGGWTWALEYEGRFRGGTKAHGFLGRMSFGF